MADPLSGITGALGGGLGSVLGGLFGGGPDYNAIFGGLSPTDVATLTKAGNIGDTAFNQISEDPRTRQAQMDALSSLQNVGNQQGMDLNSRVALTQALQQSAQQDKSRRDAVLQQMAMRGQGGSGSDLAAQLAGGQQTAQANAMSGAQAAADARTRALQAMQGAGQLGGQVRGQDYQIAANKAQANDLLNQWNARNRVNAYDTNWQQQLQRATGEAGMAPQQYQRSTNMGGAIGNLAGGAAGYLASKWGGSGGATPSTGSDYVTQDQPAYGSQWTNYGG